MEPENLKLPKMWPTGGRSAVGWGAMRRKGGVNNFARGAPPHVPPVIPLRWGAGIPLPQRYKELKGFLPAIEQPELRSEKDIFTVPKELLRHSQKRGFGIGARNAKKQKTQVGRYLPISYL